jgi:hypothetical protein
VYNVPSGSIYSSLQVNQFFKLLSLSKYSASSIKRLHSRQPLENPNPAHHIEKLMTHDEELIEACKSNYRNHQRRASTFADHHKEIIMNANIQPLPSKEVNSRNKDTGFPEPLSNGTSTKPQVDG